VRAAGERSAARALPLFTLNGDTLTARRKLT